MASRPMPATSSATTALAAASSPTKGMETGPPDDAGSTIVRQFRVLNALTTCAVGAAAWISSALDGSAPVEGMGLEAIDVAPLAHARWVEGMLILWINNRYGGGESFDYHLRKTD